MIPGIVFLRGYLNLPGTAMGIVCRGVDALEGGDAVLVGAGLVDPDGVFKYVGSSTQGGEKEIGRRIFDFLIIDRSEFPMVAG